MADEKIKILVVDDERTVVYALNMLLEDLYDVTSFTTHTCGIDALNWLKDHDVDYAILDVLINGVSGLDIANSLLKKENKPKIMIITGCSSDSNEYKKAKEMSTTYENISMCGKPFDSEGKKFSVVIKEDIANHIREKVIGGTYEK